MNPDIGYQLSPDSTWPLTAPVTDDIGGPMARDEEYRWNVPLLTYGFDQEFLDYFGQAGIDEVEAAISTLNNLPPASQIQMSNYPNDVRQVNSMAAYQRLIDFRSTVISALLEQMGLATPVRYIATMRRWDVSLNWILWCCWFDPPLGDDYILNRNYDPETTEPSPLVNDCRYITELVGYGANGIPAPPIDYVEQLFDYTSPEPLAMAEWMPIKFMPVCLFGGGINGWARGGSFCTNLTRDDTGGIRYLLHSTNLNVEMALPSVIPLCENTNNYLRTALRPGQEKITFVRHPVVETGHFAMWTNCYLDVVIVGGTQVTQAVMRVSSQPDITFSAGDLGFQLLSQGSNPEIHFKRAVARTDTANWQNHSDLNGRAGEAGPGVIGPPITITFHKPGDYRSVLGPSTNRSTVDVWDWARISQTNVTILGRHNTNLSSLTLSARTFVASNQVDFEWVFLGRDSGRFQIESSTNSSDWEPTMTLTNSNGVMRFTHAVSQPQQFFRTRRME